MIGFEESRETVRWVGHVAPELQEQPEEEASDAPKLTPMVAPLPAIIGTGVPAPRSPTLASYSTTPLLCPRSCRLLPMAGWWCLRYPSCLPDLVLVFILRSRLTVPHDGKIS